MLSLVICPIEYDTAVNNMLLLEAKNARELFKMQLFE